MATDQDREGPFELGMEYVMKSGNKNFQTDDGMSEHFSRLVPFLQIFNKAVGKNGEEGWDFMAHVYKAARNTNYSFALDEAKRDFFYRELCKFTGEDWARFFDAWGIRISSIAKSEMRDLYEPMDRMVWTYDPFTRQGGDDPLPTKYDIDPVAFSFTVNVSTATNEGPDNTIEALTDGNYSTFWHTCWSGCDIPTTLPVILDMDMQEVQSYKGIYYGNRANNGMVTKRIKIYKSNNGNDWTLLGDYTNLPASQGQREEIEFDNLHDSRYLRFEFPELNGVGQEFVALSQLGVFYDVED